MSDLKGKKAVKITIAAVSVVLVSVFVLIAIFLLHSNRTDTAGISSAEASSAAASYEELSDAAQTNQVRIAAGSRHTVGLRAGGTVIATAGSAK